MLNIYPMVCKIKYPGIIINTYEIIWEIHNFLEYSKNMSFFCDQKPTEGAYAPKTELDKKYVVFW